MECTGLDHHLTTWILEYLTNRLQYVRTWYVSPAGLQPHRIALFLFTIYTTYFSYNTTNSYVQKCSDDSAIAALITDGDNSEHRGLAQYFVDWCQQNHL